MRKSLFGFKTSRSICMVLLTLATAVTVSCAAEKTGEITDEHPDITDAALVMTDVPVVTDIPGTTDMPKATDIPTATVTPASTEVTPAITVTAATPTPKVRAQIPDVKIGKSIDFSAPSGFYDKEFELTLSVSDSETGKDIQTAKIYYTLDGSDPVTSAAAVLYTQPVHIFSSRSLVRNGEVTETRENIVSAVDPVLFSGNYSKVASGGYRFESTVKAPKDSDVDKCTVVRAVVQYADGSFGAESSAVYFVGETATHIPGIKESCDAAGRSLAVISIAMDYDDLFDYETGIYVKGKIFDDALAEYLRSNGKIKDAETARSLDANYKQHGKEWEKTASVTMLETDENGAVEVISQLCGIRIQGNYSRSDLQKGFRLYARGEYGAKNFKYPVFGEDHANKAGETMDKFDTLVLRAGGNCAFTAKFNDVFWQSLLEDTQCETQKNRPCVVYLNGEYWGLYVLEEDYSNDYFEDMYGVDKSSVVIYKGDAEKYASGYKLDEGKIPAGESEDYYFRELFDFFGSHTDLSSEADYEAFCRLVDENSVMDYFAAESWINNKWDWPGKNWSMWKAAPAEAYDGRWRFMFYDMEFGGVSGSGDVKVNTIKEDNYKPEGLLDRNTNNPAVLCFAWLMTNKGFKDRFCERLNALSETCFEKQAALERLKEYEGVYAPLYEQFFLRFPDSGSADNAVNGGYASVKCIRDFLNAREGYIGKMVEYINKKR